MSSEAETRPEPAQDPLATRSAPAESNSSDSGRLHELLLRWEEHQRRNQTVTPEDLCADCPELLPELKRRIEQLAALDALLKSDHAVEGRTTGVEDAGRYRPLRYHAGGGLGEVYVALDTELGREVALKRIRPEHAGNPESRRRFLLEAEVTGRLEHPGIVPVYGLLANAEGQLSYAMQFIQGETLAGAIARFHSREHSRCSEEDPVTTRAAASTETQGRELTREPSRTEMAEKHGPETSCPHSSAPSAIDFSSLEFRQLLQRFIAVCNALAYAHSRGIIHRDLKPQNIMLGRFGETLIVDWGLAKVVGRSGPHTAPTVSDGGSSSIEETTLRPALDTPDKTRMGRATGTPAYMSPEQAAGRWDVVGPASDIFSLGATLYCMLTNRVPYEGSDLFELQHRAQRGDFPRPRTLNPRIPPALEAICLKAMAFEPAERYESATALGDDVEHWLADEPVRAHREGLVATSRRWLRRYKGVAASLAAILVVLVGALATIAIISASHNAELESKNLELNIRTTQLSKSNEELDARKNELLEKNQFLERHNQRLETHMQRENERVERLRSRGNAIMRSGVFGPPAADQPESFDQYRQKLPGGAPPVRRILVYDDGRLGEKTTFLDDMADFLKLSFWLQVQVIGPQRTKLHRQAIPGMYIRTQPWGEQVNADWYLQAARNLREGEDAVMIVTRQDLFTAGNNFIYSTSDGAGVAVMTLNDLDLEKGQVSQRTRALKLAQSATGFLFRFGDCRRYRCAMNSVKRRADVDDLPLHCCPECEMKIWWACHIESPELRYQALSDFARERDLPTESEHWRRCADALTSVDTGRQRRLPEPE